MAELTEQEIERKLHDLLDLLQKSQDKTYKGDNIFLTLGITSQEIRHSTFLAWLFNLGSSKHIGKKFIELFCKKLFSYDYNEANAPKPANFIENRQILSKIGVNSEQDLINLLNGEMQVKTEEVEVNSLKRTDIVLDCEDTDTVVIIENKTFTVSHDDQLVNYQNRYPNKKFKILVYLTPDGLLPINSGGNEQYNDKWCIFDYYDIKDIIEDIINEKSIQKSKKMNYLLGDYVEMVDIEILKTNKTIKDLCKTICKKYGEIFNLVNKYKESSAQSVVAYCRKTLSDAFPNDIEFSNDREKSSTLYFATTEMKKLFDFKKYECRCVCGSTTSDDSVEAYIEFTFLNGKTANQTKYLTQYPTNSKAQQNLRLTKAIIISPKHDRGENFDKIKNKIDLKLKEFIDKIKNFENNCKNI